MCVWSAYSGTEEAAPLLWKSVHDIEGIWAGFYTGIVTQKDGRLFWRKCEGHTGLWKEQFDFTQIPGTCGMMHSRTNSGGDARFAHPYMACHHVVGAISQGCTGMYSDCIGRFVEAGNELLDKGFSFDDADNNPRQNYKILLKDGSRVPLSEIATSVIEEEYMRTGDVLGALRHEICRLPEESATMFLFADKPGLIAFINVNQHLVWQRRAGQVFMSVTTLGLPGGYGCEIPGNSIGYVTPSEIHIEPIDDSVFTIDNQLPAGALTAFREYLISHPGVLLGNVVDGALAPLFAHNALEYRAALGYRMLETLVQNNEIRLEEEVMKGSTGVDGRVFRLYLR